MGEKKSSLQNLQASLAGDSVPAPPLAMLAPHPEPKPELLSHRHQVSQTG